MPKSARNALAAPLRRVAEKARGAYRRMVDADRRNLVSLKPEGPARGKALVAHVVEGLLAAPDDPLIRRHNHFGEARLIAETLLEHGYAVDVISYRNRWFVPKTPYDLFICSREHFEVLAGRMPPGCIKIVHLDTAHWLANNFAAIGRLREVQQRRGVALWSMTQIGMNRGIEAADYATLLGNDFDHETYAYAGKQVFQVPNPGTLLHPWNDAKDFEACRNRFLWLGSNGLVHKGLDLLLEAFARMPDMHLTVCGPLARDPHFVQAFHRELHETPNIHAHGWIDMASPEFTALAGRTGALVYPTCADACCGSVVNCMHAGLVPLATREAGLDIDPAFGLTIAKPSVEAVEAAVRRFAARPTDQLAAMARASWQEARRVYSPERYRQVFGEVIERIVAGHPHGMVPGFVPMEASRRPGHGDGVIPRRRA